MIASVLASIGPTILNGNDTHPPMEDWSMMGGWWIWIIIIIAVILVVGLLVVLLIREKHGQSRRSDSAKSAEKLLDERYAKGEMTTEEYKEMKEEIQK